MTQQLIEGSSGFPNGLGIDSEFRSLIPRLSPDERANLERKLLREGFQSRYGKILTWNGVVVDGHNRYEICGGQNKDGVVIPVESEEVEFAGRADAMEFIIHNQSSRRNLDPVSKAELADKLVPIEAAAAKERMAAGGRGGLAVPTDENGPGEGSTNLNYLPDSEEDRLIESGLPRSRHGKAIEKAAKKVGVKANTVYRVRKVKAAGREDLLDRVKDETLSLNAAVLIADLHEKLSEPVARAVEDLAYAGHRRVLNDNAELNRLAEIDRRDPDEAAAVVDVIAGDDKPEIRSVFAAERYLFNKNNPKPEPTSAERAQVAWRTMTKNALEMAAALRNEGGFLELTKHWPEQNRAIFAAELRETGEALLLFAQEYDAEDSREE